MEWVEHKMKKVKTMIAVFIRLTVSVCIIFSVVGLNRTRSCLDPMQYKQ